MTGNVYTNINFSKNKVQETGKDRDVMITHLDKWKGNRFTGSSPRRVIPLKKNLCFSRLAFIRRQYFVMPTDGAAAARIIYCLCERHDCRNPRDRNPPRIVGAETRAAMQPDECFSHYFSRASYKLRRYSFIRRDKVHVFSCNFKSETDNCVRASRSYMRSHTSECMY